MKAWRTIDNVINFNIKILFVIYLTDIRTKNTHFFYE